MMAAHIRAFISEYWLAYGKLLNTHTHTCDVMEDRMEGRRTRRRRRVRIIDDLKEGN